MIHIPHDLKNPKLWKVWHIPYYYFYYFCYFYYYYYYWVTLRIYIINRMKNAASLLRVGVYKGAMLALRLEEDVSSVLYITVLPTSKTP